MNSRDWKDTAEIIGIVAIVASLIFVGLQMRQAHDIADSERRMLFIANRIELRSAINEHADIWARGNSNDDLDKVEAVIFENLMAEMNEFHYFASRSARNLGNETGEQAITAEFVLFLHRNSGARDVWRSQEGDYVRVAQLLVPADDSPSDWRDVIESGLEKLDQMRD